VIVYWTECPGSTDCAIGEAAILKPDEVTVAVTIGEVLVMKSVSPL
jgi:hypothetical protein